MNYELVIWTLCIYFLPAEITSQLSFVYFIIPTENCVWSDKWRFFQRLNVLAYLSGRELQFLHFVNVSLVHRTAPPQTWSQCQPMDGLSEHQVFHQLFNFGKLYSNLRMLDGEGGTELDGEGEFVGQSWGIRDDMRMLSEQEDNEIQQLEQT